MQGEIERVERSMAMASEELRRLRAAAAALQQHPAGVMRLTGASASAADVRQALLRDGAVVIECLAQPEQMDRLQAELSAIEQYGDRAEPGSFFGVNSVTNAAYIVATCPTSQELALQPLLLEILQGSGPGNGLLGAYAKRPVLAVATEIKLQGSGPAQALHRDDEEWPLDLVAYRRPGAELQLQCMWAVSDFEIDGGATCVALGSHRWPDDLEPEPEQVVAVPMPRGSVLLWLGSTLHGAGASRSDAAPRHGLLLGYCLSWLRPEFNMHFSIPADAAANMDPRMSTLLGFAGPPNRNTHPFLTGPAFATEYTGFPDDPSDYGSGEDGENFRGFHLPKL